VKRLILLSAAMLSLGLAHAANPDDVKKALDTKTVPVCARCDLTGADFSNAFMRFANLFQSDLSGAIFDRADMAGSFLEETKLDGARMFRTNASGAQFNRASLKNADLRETWLNYAHLKDADLSGADVTGAIFSTAQIQGADLSTVKGLTQAMLDRACADGRTKVPQGLRPSFTCRD
jgi:uncharacterized protein YjbI with pentapeptide repeats